MPLLRTKHMLQIFVVFGSQVSCLLFFYFNSHLFNLTLFWKANTHTRTHTHTHTHAHAHTQTRMHTHTTLTHDSFNFNCTLFEVKPTELIKTLQIYSIISY